MDGVSASTSSIPIADRTGAQRTVGRVVRPHGVAGDVAVDAHTDRPRQRFAPGTMLSTDAGRDLLVVAAREHRGRWLVRFDGYTSRADAELLRDRLLTVGADEPEPSVGPDEFHDQQLEGLTAIDADGAVLGTVAEVRHEPGQDLLVLDTERDQRLVPFVRAIVPEVDLAARRIVLDPPDGLLDG